MQSMTPAEKTNLLKSNISSASSDPEQAIAELARQLSQCKPRRTSFTVPARLKELLRFFQRCYDYFEETNRAQVSSSQTSEWLMDNFYVIEQAVRQIEGDFPAEYYQRLPKTAEGSARVYIIALANVRREDTRLEIEQIRHFLQLFQEVTPLSTGELWALPLMLRLAVLESLAEALAWVTKLSWDPISMPELTPADALRLEDDPHLIVANSITNLRLLATQDWKTFFEAASILETILRRDPVGVYARMDFETRNHYRNAVEELANGSTMSEAEIAGQTLQLAQAGASAREQHVGYYLVAGGRDTLETQIKFRPSLPHALIRTIQRNGTAVYLGGITVLTLLLSSLIVIYTYLVGGALWHLVVAGVLSLLPVSSVAIDLINGLIMSLVPPRTLPKLSLEGGVPEDYRTIVVIPALLASERDAPFLLGQIERHFIGNSDPNIFFALLTDFADAPKKETPDDLQPVEQTRAAIEALNKKYANGNYRPFYFFHRERVWNEGEERWMGWERKRGKLEEFNRLLSGSDSTTFMVKDGDLSVLPTIRYVITLDADTMLPREAAGQLIGTLAHPLNRAEFDPATGEVVAGYTILQPRAQVRPAASNRSLFTRVYSGDSVIDLYTRAVSD
ncbi:MAG TPA: hypothetical protein VGK56_00290, partial [Anaerolineales bacterium]